MTTRFKISLAAGLVAVALAAGAPMLIAQDGPQRRGPGPMAGGGMRGPGGPGFHLRASRFGGQVGLPMRELDLSDDQRAQLKKIRDAHEAEFKQAGEKMRAAREGMRALVEADTINEGAIRAKSAEVAAAEAEVAILNAKVRQESRQILTAEQQQKLKELRASRPGPGPMKRRQRGQ